MYKDKIYKILRNDRTRNKILEGKLRRDDCDNEQVYQFLKLLKVPERQRCQCNKVITEENQIKVVKQSKKRSASSIFSKRTYAVYKCALSVKRMTYILVAYYNILIQNGYYPKRWLKILDTMLSKGKGMVIGKLRIITLIEGDLQFLMRVYLGGDDEEMIENNNRLSKANYGLRKNYSIESAILEKRLIMDNSLLSRLLTIYHLTDLQACYNRQLAEVGRILEESVGRDRKALKLIAKVIPNQNHYISTLFRISDTYYGGEDNHLAGTGKGNRFLGNVCQDTSYLIMK